MPGQRKREPSINHPQDQKVGSKPLQQTLSDLDTVGQK